jgi:methanogenic corrinoid protein MtbC1
MGQGRSSFSSSFESVFSISRTPRTLRPRVRGGDTDGDSAGSDASLHVLDAGDADLNASVARKIERQRRIDLRERERVVAFVTLLFDENSDACEVAADAAAAASGDPQQVVDQLFDPAARIIGERWCGDECDFFKVTVAMSRMQRLFRRITSDFPPTVRSDISRCVLLAPAPGEEHLFGLSVVDDAFRRAGWEVDCCGHGEAAEMLQLVAVNHYQVIGVSVSVDRHLPDLAAVVQKLKAKSLNRSVAVMAGGSMVMRAPQSATDAGFDMLAVDAMSAVRLAEAVVSRRAFASDQRMAAE